MVATRSTTKAGARDATPKVHADRPLGKRPSSKSGQVSPQGVPTITAEFRKDVITTMDRLLSRLSSDTATICPSQIPRLLNKESPSLYRDWRAMMGPTREVVWEQVKSGRVQVTQTGEVRDYEDRDQIKGPIRVRRGPEWEHTT